MRTRTVGWPERSRHASAAVASGLSIACTVVLSGVSLYCRNAAEFSFRLTTILPWLAIVWGGLLLAVAVPQLLMLGWKRFTVVNAVYLGLGGALWLQCVVLSDLFPDAPSLEPQAHWDLAFLAVLNLALLLGIVAAAAWKHRWVSRNAWKLALIAILSKLLPGGYRVLTYTEPEYGSFDYAITEDQKFTFASRENVILLVVDSMSEALFKEVLKAYPEVSESFRDFTCFDRMISPIPRTLYAVPAMLSGMRYSGEFDTDGEQAHHAYVLRALRSPGALPTKLKSAGYRSEAYPYILNAVSYGPELLDNVEPRRGHKQSLDCFADTLVLKMIPFFTRPLVFGSYLSLTDRFVTPRGGTVGKAELPYDVIFYRRLQSEFRLGDFEKGFKYLHLHGAHKPLWTDENVDVTEDTDSIKQLRGALRIAGTLVEELRKAQVYDDAVIVITGDHSEHYTPEVVTLIKRPGDHGTGVRLNSVPCQVADIAGTVLAAKHLGSPERSIFGLPPVASLGLRDGPVRIVLHSGLWRKGESRDDVAADLLNTAFQLRRGVLEVCRPLGWNESPCTLSFSARDLVSNALWQTERVESTGQKGPEAFQTDFAGLPDGIYRLHMETGSSDGTALNEVETPSAEIVCFGRYVKVDKGEVSLHAKIPGLEPRSLQPNETIVLRPMQPYPQLEYSDDCTFSLQGMRVSNASALRVRIPGGKASLSLKMELGVMSMHPAFLAVLEGEVVVTSIPLKSGHTQCVAEFVIPPDARLRGELDLRLRLENRYKNRSPRMPQMLRIRSISLK